MQQTSLSASRYALLFTDNHFRKSWVYFLKHKSETVDKFLIFKKLLENKTGHRIQVLYSNWGGEYTSTEFSNIYKASGIRRKFTQAHTP